MKTVVYSSPFVPAEWLAAHGVRPFRLMPRQAAAGRLGVREGLCPFMESFVGEVGNGGEDASRRACENASGSGREVSLHADAVVFATTCDQMRRGAELLGGLRDLPTFLLNVPATWQTVAAQRMYVDELRRLGRFLETLAGRRPSDAELAATMLRYESARAALLAARPGMSARGFVEAWFRLHSQPEAEPLDPHPNPLPKRDRGRGIPLAVVGGPLLGEDLAVLDLIEQAGGQVVLDGCETGERTLPGPFDRRAIREQPLAELGNAYFGAIGDAFRRPNTRLYAWLREKLADRGARGIVFVRQVWCDLWHGELGRLREWTELPVLDLDVCGVRSARESAATRIQSFLEILRTPSTHNLLARGSCCSSPPHPLAPSPSRLFPASRRLRVPASHFVSPPRPLAPSPPRLFPASPRARVPASVDMPAQISLAEWDARWERTAAGRGDWPAYVGPLGRHVAGGDRRLLRLRFDNSPAALRLWNFLLTEEERLAAARASGKKLVAAMKDLGTVPVLAFSFAGLAAFYPDGAWWAPCMMELGSGDLEVADRLGIDESFCPVRAMLGAFVRGAHFPRPDLLVCSAGATCDDFSAIAQRLAGLGWPILWWEAPHRRRPDPGEPGVQLPGGFVAPRAQVEFVRAELGRVRSALESLAGRPLSDAELRDGIRQANRFRRLLGELRRLAYSSEPCPLGGLEMLIVEMLAIHFCSDRAEAIAVVEELLAEVRRRVDDRRGVLPAGAVRTFWVNPVADLRVMNLLEECGGRLCGSEFLFSHALDELPDPSPDIEPMESLARMALADPMVGSAGERAERICRDAERFGAEAVVVSRIPGASHCAGESVVIGEAVRSRLGLPAVEIEVPPIADSLLPSLRTRIEALMEAAGKRRG